MADLLINLSDLGTLKDELDRVKAQFENVETIGAQTGDLVGDADLRGKVNAFAKKWDARRGEISDAIGALSGAVDKIHMEFVIADHQLAQPFKPQPSNPVT